MKLAAAAIMRLATILLLPAALLLTTPLDVGAKGGGRGGGSKSTGPVRVKPYTRKDGTQVQGHRRTAPDSTRGNNWSTRGNVNPDTGKAGTRSETP